MIKKSQGGRGTVEGRPSPNEKSTVNKGDVTNSGRGKGGASATGYSPLTASYDSRAYPGDNKAKAHGLAATIKNNPKDSMRKSYGSGGSSHSKSGSSHSY